MEITVTIPDELARQIIPEGLDPARRALEDMAVEAYRAHRLSGSQLRRLLGISSRYDLDGFLKKRGVWLEYTLEDFRREGEITAPLLAQQGSR
jgi:predicted HTH domain antitoxin